MAVADVFPEEAQAFATEHGIPVASGDPEAVLSRDDVHLVSVCTPPFEHAPLTIAALQAGKHVLCEKPMAGSLAECDAMIAAARAANRTLAVVFQYRYEATVQRLKALIDHGKLGRILFAKLDALWWRGREYYDVWWRGTWEKECGGATLNHACHHLDVFLYLLGQPTWVTAITEDYAHGIEVDDYSTALVRFENGVTGTIVATVAAHHNLDRIEIFGERASAARPWEVRAMRSRPQGGGFGLRDSEREQELIAWAEAKVPEPEYQGHAAEIADLLRCLREGGIPRVPGEEGRRCIELISGIYLSAATGQPVTLPLGPECDFYTREEILARAKRHTIQR